jgi:hypothetical protein
MAPQEWDRTIAEATKPFRLACSSIWVVESVKTALHRECNEQELHNALTAYVVVVLVAHPPVANRAIETMAWWVFRDLVWRGEHVRCLFYVRLIKRAAL